ncbi:MAG: DUF2608 domain-containing protein [Gammaproteobacteria bacterium]|jgi:hypothetical protein|nr:DUF2608 domain-containing protein [Gammaproteobacteria bacterium]
MSKPKTLKKLSESSNSKIYETSCFKDGLYFLEKQKYSHKRRLALYDIDNTVLSYRHTLGTDQWFDFDFNEYIKLGLTAQKAKKRTLSEYLNLVKKIHPDDVYVVEEDTPEIIRKIQRQGTQGLVLTSRGSYLLTETTEQLQRFGIDFNKSTFRAKEMKLPQSEEGLFHHGMILTGGYHKGECLVTCLENMKKLPQFIIMWDDRLTNLERVRDSIELFNTQKGLGKDSIQFVGLRYSKLDHVTKEVKPDVIKLQKTYINRVLSDEHAQAILRSENKKLKKQCVDIDCQPKNDSVILSLSKHALYQILKGIEPSIDKYRILGEVKELGGKLKLSWQFKFTMNNFAPLFHKLSKHGLIESSQFDLLSAIFNKKPAPITKVYSLRSHQASKHFPVIVPSSRHTMKLRGIRS